MDRATRRNILIVAESSGSTIPATTYELLSLAQRLARASGGSVCVMMLGVSAATAVQALTASGADRVLLARYEAPAALSAEARLPSVVEACARTSPCVVLLAHGVLGAELGPRLAFRLGGVAVTGCIDVALEAGVISCTRPCYGGLAREVNDYSHTPVVATIRSGVFEPAPAVDGRQARIENLSPVDPAASRVRVLERISEPGEGIRLEDARVIVAGGRGLEGPEGFAVLQELAAELGAAVGSSRVPCDLGWCPHSWQIGLTGKTVTPELYFAVGISGAGHHMAGCGNAKTIVAINTDPDAAIFQDARFGIVGDYRQIVPALAAEIRRLKQAG